MREFVHQVRAGRAPKKPGDLVQRERKNKVLRGFVHQVRAGAGAEKARKLGAKGTKEQGFEGIRAPSSCRPSAEKVRRLGAKGTKEQGFAGVRAPTPCRKIGKGGPDTGRVGARLPAKPCTSVTRRQHFAVKPGRRRLQLIRQPAAKNNKKRATSVARSWCAIRGSNPGHPD